MLKEAEHIKPIDNELTMKCKEHWNAIGKPLYGLGNLEDLIAQIGGIKRTVDVRIKKRAVVVMCSDNGVVSEGISQTGQEVTAIVSENFAKGIASVNAMSKVAGAMVIPVDIGVAKDLNISGILKRKISYGTKNFKTGPAMSDEDAKKAIRTGIEVVRILQEEGYDIIATGEMGIGNTTTSSAVASVLLDVEPQFVTGIGAGLSKEGVKHKVDVIREGIRVNQPNKEDSIDVVSKVGGLDIAGLAGIFLGGAIYQVPIIIDGVISATAALVAKTISPLAVEYMIPSHLGKEPASKMLMDTLGLEPMIHGNLALGEGTGGTLMFPMLDMALAVYQQNKTFDDISVETYHTFDI